MGIGLVLLSTFVGFVAVAAIYWYMVIRNTVQRPSNYPPLVKFRTAPTTLTTIGPLKAPSYVDQGQGSWDAYNEATGELTLVAGHDNFESECFWDINPGNMWNISFTSTTSPITNGLVDPSLKIHDRVMGLGVYMMKDNREKQPNALAFTWNFEDFTLQLEFQTASKMTKFTFPPSLIIDNVPHVFSVDFDSGLLSISIDAVVIVNTLIPNFQYPTNIGNIVLAGSGKGYNIKHTIKDIYVVGNNQASLSQYKPVEKKNK